MSNGNWVPDDRLEQGAPAMLEKRYICLAVLVFLLTAVTRAGSVTNPDLKQIMQGLQNDSTTILDGLLVDDLESVARAAARVADHPQIPPTQVTIVATELGAEMAAFKQFDTQVHNLSLAIQSAALENDRNSAVANYHQMISTCLACHTAYRIRVAGALSRETVDD
jgi:cytochrome c556